MDHVALWKDVDREVTDGMTADINTYVAVLACPCEGLCVCDDSDAMAAALHGNTVDLTQP